jgi:phage protein D
VVLAEDALQGARMHRRTQVHADVTLRRLAEDLARSLGQTPVITGLSDSIGTHVQLNESDLAFVRRLLRDYDADLQVVGSELHVSPRSDAARGEITLEMYSQLLQVRVLADLAHQRTEVSVAGWDGARGERVTATSRGAQLAPGQGRSGAQILEDALGPRSEHLGQVPVTNAAEAQALADALFDQAARRFVCVQGTAEGNPALRVGSQLRVKGLSPRFDNVYYVVAALHRYDMRRGYETEFEAECAYLGGV